MTKKRKMFDEFDKMMMEQIRKLEEYKEKMSETTKETINKIIERKWKEWNLRVMKEG